MLKKLLCAVVLGVMMVIGFSAEASVDVSHLPIVKVKDKLPIEKVLERPTEEKPFVSGIQWSDKASHNKLKKIYLSATFDEEMFKKVKDEENLAFEITELIDKGFEKSEIKITPFIEVKKDSYNIRDMVNKLSLYDAGIVINVEKQDKGEVIFRGFLEFPGTKDVYMSYSARGLYDKNDGLEGKKAVFNKALREFVYEIISFKNQ